jgi:hypothetical protein
MADHGRSPVRRQARRQTRRARGHAHRAPRGASDSARDPGDPAGSRRPGSRATVTRPGACSNTRRRRTGRGLAGDEADQVCMRAARWLRSTLPTARPNLSGCLLARHLSRGELTRQRTISLRRRGVDGNFDRVAVEQPTDKREFSSPGGQAHQNLDGRLGWAAVQAGKNEIPWTVSTWTVSTATS